MNSHTVKLLQKHFDTALETPDGIKKLRELILTLAMQGKLIPQDPKDQPASELLKEIEAEKKRLVKEGKIRKQEPLPQITKDEVPYEIPSGWKWVRLYEIAEYNGRTNAAPDEISPDTWVLDLEDIEKDTSTILYRAVYSERQSKSTKSKFCKGDVLYGKLRPYLDKVVVADRDGVCTTEIVPIVPFNGVDSLFLKTLLKRPSFIAHVNVLSYGVKMPRLGTADAIKSIHPLPPLAEQRRIVAKIDELMALCDRLEAERNESNQKRLTVHTAAMNRLLTSQDKESFSASWSFIVKHFSELYAVPQNVAELKKAILQLAVMGKLVPQDPKDQPASELLKEIEAQKKRLVKEGKIKPQMSLPEIMKDEVQYDLPTGWKWVRLNDVLDVRDGTHDTPKYVDIGYPLITSKNLYTGSLSFEDVKYISKEDHLKIKERSIVERGDILFAMIGSIGNPVIVNTDDDFSIKNVALFKYYRPNTPETKYVHCFLIYAQEKMKLISSGAVQSFVSLGFLRNYLLPLPPLAEQRRIVAKVDQLMAFCDDLEKQIAAATVKQAAIFNAVLAQV